MTIKPVHHSKYYNMPRDKQEKTLKCLIKQASQTDNVLIRSMHDIVAQHVQHYQTDFYVHDIYNLLNSNNNNFVWIVRDAGTHLIEIDSDFKRQADLNKIYYNDILKTFNKIKAIYLIDKKHNTLRLVKDCDKVSFTYKYADIAQAVKDKAKQLQIDWLTAFDIEQSAQKENIATLDQLNNLIKRHTIKAV